MKKQRICKICGFDAATSGGLSRHILGTHKIDSKKYYDKYIKRKNEGFCKLCGNPTSWISINLGYLTYCSTKCCNSDPELTNKKVNTAIDKYGGVGNASPVIRKRTSGTLKKKYGVYVTFKSKKIRNKGRETKKIRYGDENYNNREKASDTCYIKYKKKNVMQVKKFQNKAKDTNFKNTGYYYPMQNPKTKNKSIKVQEDKYGGVGFASKKIS